MEISRQADDAITSSINVGQPLRFSNFLITVSTNVVPQNTGERIYLTSWLRDVLGDLFGKWEHFNGTVIKPAGSPNSERVEFGDNHKIISVRSRISIEKGNKKGQMHAHVLLEIAHAYAERNKYGFAGVHVNRQAICAFLDERIIWMGIDIPRQPNSIYVNSKLLTKGTDNSNKWLTLHYLNKDRDRSGLDLEQQRRTADPKDREIAEGLKKPDATYTSDTW